MSRVTRILWLIVLVAVLTLISSCGGGAGASESILGPEPPGPIFPKAPGGEIIVSTRPPFAAAFSWTGGTPAPHAVYAIVEWDASSPESSTSSPVRIASPNAEYTYGATGTYALKVRWYDGTGTLLRTDDFTLVLKADGNMIEIFVSVP